MMRHFKFLCQKIIFNYNQLQTHHESCHSEYYYIYSNMKHFRKYKSLSLIRASLYTTCNTKLNKISKVETKFRSSNKKSPVVKYFPISKITIRKTFPTTKNPHKCEVGHALKFIHQIRKL